MTARILTMGEPLVEMVRLPAPVDGKPVYQQGVGGDTLNAAIAAARQGGSVGCLTAVGGDPFGEEILAACRAEGIDTAHVRVRPQDPTGVNFILPDPKGRRFSYARRGSAASLYGPPDVPEEAVAAADIVHVSAIGQAISPSMRAAVMHAARIARAAGTLVSYDLNLRLNLWTLEEARAAAEELLPFVDIVLPSDDEAGLLAGSDDVQAMIGWFGRFGAADVVLKRGDKGVVLSQRGVQMQVPAPQVSAVDSTGAGDSFAGAYLAYRLETGDSLEAARRAVVVAAATVCGFGATDPIPRRAEVMARL